MNKFTLLVALLFFTELVFSQTTITGKIIDKKNQPLSDVSIMLLNTKDSSILAYTSSDEKGNYEIKTNNTDKEFLLSIFTFGIKKEIKRVENCSQTVNFSTEENSIELREVIVKSQKIWGTNDTINYSVSAFKNKKDVVISDVLKKMPGISVTENGEIYYKGKPINKFYIENMDMLGGRYGIATNNVSVGDVSTVQVLENHQPIKALKSTQFSSDAAINLKIRDDRRGILSATAVAGGGYNKKLLWHGELTGMYFGRDHQHISSYKADNAGNNIFRELNSYYSNNGITPIQMTGMSIPSGPDIRFDRYFFNNSHAATVNNIKKLKNDAEINYNALFYHNKENRHSFSKTTYLQPSGDNPILIDEDISTGMRNTHLEGELRYSRNALNKYFSNYLNAYGNWQSGMADISNSSNINQQYKNIFFNIMNVTHLVKTHSKNGKGFEFVSVNSTMRQPHSLTVTPGLYPFFFNENKSYVSLTQNVVSSGFASNNRLSLLSAWMIKNVRISPTVYVNIEDRLLQTDFRLQQNNGISKMLNDTSLRNDIRWLRLKSSAGFDVSYQSERIKFSMWLPFVYDYSRLHNVFNNAPYTRGKLYFQPSGNFTYIFGNNWDITAAYGFNVNSPGLSSLYSGYILTDYRSLNHYEARIFDTFGNGGSLNFSYKDILSLLFFGGGVSYSHYWSNASYGQTMNGILTITQLNEIPNKGKSVSVNARFSKGIDWKGLVFTINATTGKSMGQQIRQNVALGYQNRWISVDASFNMKFTKWLFIDYKAAWRNNQTAASTEEKLPVIRSFNQKGTMTVELPLGVGINATYEHYYNNALPEGNRNFSLADLGMTYLLGRTTYSLNWTNILNISKFITSSYGDLNSYYSEYDIRPAQIMLSVRFRLK